jgi:thiol-disulfide isomerase/thioredoxin
MSNIITSLSRFFKPYGRYVLIVLLLILFISIARFAYSRFSGSSRENLTMQSDIANAPTGGNKDVEIYFFHADWCPHCIKAQPEWDKFVKTNDGKTINGYKVQCVDVNCTSENDEKSQALISTYSVQSYPTVKMQNGKDVIEFDSKITQVALEEFCNTVLV